jgi:hypothetical protein
MFHVASAAMAKQSKKSSKVEWSAGIFSTLPELNIVSSANIDLAKHMAGKGNPADYGQPSRTSPDTLIWMSADGTIIGKTEFPTNQAALHVVANFWQTTKSPLAGTPQVPERIVIGDPLLASIVRHALAPDIEVVNEDTMDLDDAVMDELELYGMDTDSTVPEIAAVLQASKSAR